MTASQTLRRLVAPLVDPAVYDFWAQKLSPTLSWDRCLARVVDRQITARDTVSLILRPNGHFRGFLPGQHLNVTVEVNGRRVTRSYSPSDTPRPDGTVRLTIKAIPGGRVSQHLVHHTRVGDVLELGAAFGDMTLPAESAAWLFVAAGSGITPIMSLLGMLTRQPLQQPVTLVYWARTRADLCFIDTLARLSAAQPLLQVHTVLTREPAPLSHELTGRPSEGLFRQLVPDLERRRVVCCGPFGFVEQVRSLLGDQAARFQAEAFTPAPAQTTPGAPVMVTLARSQVTVQIPSGMPLLEALEAQGLTPAYGCRMGICNTCSCQKHAGTTTDTRNGTTQEEPGPVRLCINSASSDLTLDL